MFSEIENHLNKTFDFVDQIQLQLTITVNSKLEHSKLVFFSQYVNG